MLSRRPLLAALAALAGPVALPRAALAAEARADAPRGADLADASRTLDALIAPRELKFPRDFGAHLGTRTEWWYATGALRTEAGETLGFQLTFFRSRTGLGREDGGRFAPRQLLSAHAALSEIRAGKLHHAQRLARWNEAPDAPLAAASVRDTDVFVNDWLFRRSGDAGASRYRARLADRDAGFAYEIELAATQPLLLQGEAGFSRKGPQAEQASHYYSEPQLAVTGTLWRGQRRDAVTGRAWLDHEWSEAILAPGAAGWDWIGMNLDDGGALMAFQIRRRDGSALWAGGTYRDADGTRRKFEAKELTFTPGRTWQSPGSQARYPVEWTIETPVGRFGVRALMDAQELDARSSTAAIYWEGLSELRDAADGRRIGQGYLEMTGYASPLRLG
ncbi:lipocalin-like domain-containing protein [Azohydromonas caseinilytica]|uniref:Carotenoid 1,2-hydratase n=1 Tax=Azohydromonas caseinilytica TaxID=2728836 RepID=A0A848F9X8_9BURK|nr:carotenoid 1,2-hydratase [Azohydromonas caseinilytica]NML15555.1 carotenoid 1,2-hydratase [Azohydromonas caseinilytica]